MNFFWLSAKVAIAIILIGSLSACAIERMRSEHLFEQYCNEEGRVGQFIYEHVALGDEYFRDIPTDQRKLDRIGKGYYLYNEGKKLLINKQRFKQSYITNDLKKVMISPIGPIYSVESTIVRKLDGKVLSKAVSLLNMRGQTRGYFPVEGVTCPTGRDSKGSSLYYESHTSLIQNTFFEQ